MIIKDFTTRATYHSNSIEGNTISMAETYAIVFNKKKRYNKCRT